MQKSKPQLRLKKLSLIFIFLFSSTIFADSANKPSAEFFLSNNTGEIDLQTAFKRLQGNEQHQLRNTIINIMQKKHFEQSSFVDVLGTYQMSDDQQITADNSEKVITSSYQSMPSAKVFDAAKELADILKQDSVAVFIPDNGSAIGDTTLKLTSHPYTINETIKIIHEKLSPQYSQAFSLHLKSSGCSTFNNSIVDEVEWLGSKVNADDIKKSFPQEKITTQQGKAYLIYKTGQKDQL